MLLDRIDIDAHGPLHRVELGPLAEGLNTVWGPEGAGKTAIVRFLRDSLVSRDYPLGMMSSSTGRVVWADRHGMVHCRREQDGTPAGRRTIEFESRGEYPLRFDSLQQSWIRGAASTNEATLALQSIRLAESLVDGVITDTMGTSAARAVAACRHAGLDSVPDEPEAAPGTRGEEATARQQLLETDAELARFDPPAADEPTLAARRDRLRARLAAGGEPSRPATEPPAPPVDDAPEWTDREAIVAELRRIDDQLAAHARLGWLRRRRAALCQKLGDSAADAVPAPSQSPLAEAASRWLAQLSSGRLQRLDWTSATGHPTPSAGQPGETPSVHVRIDHRGEASCGTADRMLAVIAVRLAAAETLCQRGCSVPLVLEISDRGWQQLVRAAPAPAEPAQRPTHRHDAGRPQHPVVTALLEHTAAGNQVLVLTASRALAGELTRAGSRNFSLHSHRIVHPHRPIWQPQYAPEHYVGPHPHTYGPHTHPDPTSADEINRDFDAAWREAYGIHSPAIGRAGSPAERAVAAGPASRPMTAPASPPLTASATSPAVGHSSWPDGYYFADHYTTAAPGAEAMPAMAAPLSTQGDRPAGGSAPRSGPRTGASWVADHRAGDGAAASSLSDAPASAPETPFFLTVDSPIDQAPSIDAVAAARLRGLGITHITHLMQQDANRLADTLGMANVNAASVRRWRHECRLVCNVPQLRGFDARLLVGCGITDPAQLAAMHPSDLLDRVEAFLTTERGQRILLSGTSYELARITSWMAAAGRAGQRDDQREEEDQRDVVRMRGSGQRSQRKRATGDATSAPAAETSGAVAERDVREDFELRFYLDRNSDVVDAPSIGPRMAERLAELDIETVDDLFGADPDEVAEELDHRRVDAETVRQWQQQAELVCRVPQLRGHDAQLLIAAGVTTAEQLADADPQQLHGQIDPIAQSRQGRRILRGGRLPDASEVADWVTWAGHHRELKAA